MYGVRWCAVVCGGVRRCAVVCGGVRRAVLICQEGREERDASHTYCTNGPLTCTPACPQLPVVGYQLRLPNFLHITMVHHLAHTATASSAHTPGATGVGAT